LARLKSASVERDAGAAGRDANVFRCLVHATR
jgi:hypothetical protein